MKPPLSTSSDPSAQDRQNWPNSASPPSTARRAVISATDGEHLMRFCRHRDESAFAAVVDAHAKMVWGVCWQILRHRHDVEDAFQATFMILARKAATIHANDSAAAWLYRVAMRTSITLRHRRRRRTEQPILDEPLTEGQQLAAVELCEQRSALLEELAGLPDRYQQPLVLHYLEGLTRRETAAQLGWSETSVKGRLARGRRLLRTRLARRGVALSTAMAALSVQIEIAQASVTTTLVTQAANTAYMFKFTPSAPIDPAASTIAREGLLSMSIASVSKMSFGVLAVGMISLVVAVSTAEEPPSPSLSSNSGALDLAHARPTSRDAATNENPMAITSNSASTLSVGADSPSTNRSGRARVRSRISATSPKPTQPAESQFVAAEAPSYQPPGLPPQPVQPPPISNPNATVTRQRPRSDAIVASDFPARLATSAQPVRVPVVSATTWTTPNKQQLQLEMEYWQLKAKGLQKKAEVMMQGPANVSRVRALYDSGSVPSGQANEAELARAEAMLLLAEVKLCESNAAGIKHQLATLAEQSLHPSNPPSPEILQPAPQSDAYRPAADTQRAAALVPAPAASVLQAAPTTPRPEPSSVRRAIPILTGLGSAQPPAVRYQGLPEQINRLEQQNSVMREEMRKVLRALEALRGSQEENSPEERVRP